MIFDYLIKPSKETKIKRLKYKQNELLSELKYLNERKMFDCDKWFVGEFLAERNKKRIYSRIDELEKEIIKLDKEIEIIS